MLGRRYITLCRKLAACLTIIVISLIAFGCASRPEVQGSSNISVSSSEIDILETCKRNLSIASPDTLRSTISLLAESEAGRSEAGTEYAYLAAQLMKHVYPVVMGDRRVPEPPAGSIYPELFSRIEAGDISEISQDDISFLTVLTLPVAVLYSDSKSVESASLDSINQAVRMNPKSVLPLFLRGYINERNTRFDEALADYSKALELDPSCYPAEIGTARIYIQTGQNDTAAATMDLLAAQYPYSIEILTIAANTRLLINDYNGALEYSSEVLRTEPDNPEILMLRAKVFLAQENLLQASRLIEVLDRRNWDTAEFYIVKSSIERSGGDNLSAMNTLEKGREKYPENKSIEEAYGAVLMLTGRRDEAREILIGKEGGSVTGSQGLLVLIDDAVEMEDWKAAEQYAERLQAADNSLSAGMAVWKVWYLQGNYQAALNSAESLYESYPDNIDAAITYVKSLLSLNRRLQAERIINGKIVSEKDSRKKSELYYLKSITDDTEEQKLQSLRSALFEDLQNIDALSSISGLYLDMGDIRKAYRYIKQAAALAPDNQNIKQEMADIEEQLQ